MEIVKEGLHIYGVTNPITNEDFFSLEYPLIKYNRPKTLLPMILREQDGTSVLLYDISEGKTMEKFAAGRGLSLEDCKEFLNAFAELLNEMEELMLEPEHIHFSPDGIYRTRDSQFCWMYCPDEENDLSSDVQKFFSWMLSEIDYGDSDTVRFVYHVYWVVKNRSLSEELLRECLRYRGDEEEKKLTTYESFFGDQTEYPEVPSETGLKKDRKGRKDQTMEKDLTTEAKKKVEEFKKMSDKMKILTGIQAGLVLVIAVGILGTVRRMWFLLPWGFTGLAVRSLAGCIVLTVIAVICIYYIQKYKKKIKGTKAEHFQGTSSAQDDQKFGGKAGTDDELYPEYGAKPDHGMSSEYRGKPDRGMSKEEYDMWDGDASSEKRPRESDIWEGTVRLNPDQKRGRIGLRCAGTGELFEIQSFPYYIGNENGLNNLSIADKTVSRNHAVIKRGEETGVYTIEDLNSTNGTWVDNDRLGSEPVILSSGAVLKFSGREYQFEIE